MANDDLVLIDARSRDEYLKGHLPGAINLPPDMWRTPSAEPGEGDSQDLFRDEEGNLDVARYEGMLGDHGIARDTPVVVYGNHAGKADGSVPAMILDMLGHEHVAFLDGVGVTQWQAAGYDLTTDLPLRRKMTYEAEPREQVLWNLDDVRQHLGKDDVVMYDTRSQDEYDGKEVRDNARGGRIPGAVLYDYADLLDDDKTAVSPDAARAELERRGMTPDRTLVLYCQTATRVSLPYLLLKDLGYERVSVYDASWHEWGNRDDTPVEGETSTE